MSSVARFTLFLLCLLLSAPSAPAQSPDRAQIEREIFALRAQLQEKEKSLLAVSAEDLVKYADFLAQPDTGLVRLLPREKYDGILTVRGGGAYYAFTKQTHEYGYGSDVALERGALSTGFAGADFGMLTVVGDVPLEEVTLAHPSVTPLVDFKSPSEAPEARKEQRRTSEGFQANGFKYAGSRPARVDTTYVLRSINYDNWDVLVAFRAFREDPDGSIVLSWKLLRRFPTPRLFY
jgi:hypothetical protein